MKALMLLLAGLGVVGLGYRVAGATEVPNKLCAMKVIATPGGSCPWGINSILCSPCQSGLCPNMQIEGTHCDGMILVATGDCITNCEPFMTPID